MNQEFLQRRRILTRIPPERVYEEVRRGNKFIVLEEDIDIVPESYVLVDMKYKGDSFKTLVPQQLLFYLANPGEGSIDDALENVADFYNEVEDFEDGAINEGSINVQDINWATTSRSTYQVYLINKLTKNGKDYDKSVLDDLCLNHEYVQQRTRGIAALILGKTAEEIKEAKLTALLKHVTISRTEKKVTENLSKTEAEKVRCYAGSHWELKPEYQTKGPEGESYSIGPWGSVKKTYVKSEEIIEPVINKQITQLEDEIQRYREGKSKKINRHDRNLIRQYINLCYITKENQHFQLDIKPSEILENDNPK